MIADTSVWIEFLKGREPPFSRLEFQLRQRKVVAFVAVSFEMAAIALRRLRAGRIKGRRFRIDPVM